MKFDGQIKFPDIDHPGVPVSILIEDNQAELVIDGDTLGRWSLFDVHARRLVSSAFQVELDGHEVTFIADKPMDFAYRGVEHMAEVWARFKAMNLARRTVAVKLSRRGTLPSRINELEQAMLDNLTAERVVTERLPGEEVASSQPAPRPTSTLAERLGDSTGTADDSTEDAARVAAEDAARLQAERDAVERIAAEREAARLRAESDAEERLAAEREAAERHQREMAERHKVEAQRLEDERAALDSERARIEEDRQRLAAERAAAEREVAESIAAARSEIERLESERAELAKAETEQVERQRLEAEQSARLKEEREALEAKTRELHRLEAERVEAERREAERLETERIKAERLEAERLETQRLLEAERAEAERLEAERLEAERVQAEKDAAGKKMVKELLGTSAEASDDDQVRDLVVDLGEFETPDERETPIPAPEPALATAAQKSGLMGAVRAAFARNGGRNHVHDFVEAPGGIGMVRSICRECGFVSISTSD